MRRILLLAVCSLLTSVLLAGPVTKEQAQQVASQFLQDRAAASGSHRAAADLQTSYSGEVSGLYVFNVVGNNGFVIISNDDCAEPVLGYADSGSFDLNNIPDNMRAWLQGYADEIAWAKSHGVKKRADSTARRAGSVKTVINPLVQTQWDQSAPYNNLCPEYISGEHSVTGCVATAMAQVMYYYQCPTADISATIPAYDKDFNEQAVRIPLESNLPIITFDWKNMQTKYTGAETNAQETAVAQLMYYAGCSVRMDYGPSSGASTSAAADALKTYFNYAETTVSKNRSFFTYANWIDMLYNELKYNRVILYSGTSTGGGHAFICDGYATEDYFHINWGWGGNSDGHFKLSALDPDNQGIGGSTSTDGFNYLQGAIVGIQKAGDKGTVLATGEQTPNLQLMGVSLSSSSITHGESVNVTLTVKNNSEKKYDGEIYVYVHGQGTKAGKSFVIAAGETKDCVIPFTPQFTGTASIYAAFPAGSGGSYYIANTYHQNLTVNEGGSSKPKTNNIDLTYTVTAENTESSNIWGRNFHGQLTVNNPSTTHDYDGYVQYNLYQDGESWKPLGYKSTHVVIPASGNVVIPIEYSGLVNGTQFLVRVTYYNTSKDGNWSNFEEAANYSVKAAIITYAPDGTETVTKPSGTSYTVSAGTSSVDLSDTGITTVTNASEPNCVFILDADDTAPAGASIIVRYNGANYTADNITITDGYNFYSPVDFTATNIEFTYSNDRWADGTKGWNTIILPFNVTSVTADDTPIDWFHSSSDTGKQFWLKEFTGDGVGSVSFNYVSGTTMLANTPYIVAFPGDHWGETYNLSGKTIKFIGSGEVRCDVITSVTGSNYRFMGNNKSVSTENIYCINAAGSSFDLKASGGSPAFRAYFKPGIFDSTVTSLSIGGGGSATGISSIEQKTTDDGQYYNLNGQRVGQPTKGLYIKNGKKVIVK